MQTDMVKERFRQQRAQLGLEEKEEVYYGSNGNLITKEEVMEEVRKYDRALAKEAEVDIGEEAEAASAGEGFMAEEPAKENKAIV